MLARRPFVLSGVLGTSPRVKIGMRGSQVTAPVVIAGAVLRAHVVQQPFRALLTVTGVALGVVAAVAIAAANIEVLRTFERAVVTIAGPATLEVSGSDLGLDESLLGVIRATEGIVKAAPVIEEAFVLLEGAQGPESVQVYGLDLVGEAGRSGFRLERGTADEALNDLLKRDTVYVGRLLSEDRSLRQGSTVQARAGSRLIRLRVAGIVEGTDRPASYWNRVMIMDVAAAQVVFDMIGRLDRIEIETAQDRMVDDVAADLRAVLPPSVVVQRPAQRTAQVERMV